MISEVAKAIKNSDLGLNPVSDAEGVRLNIPAMTEERRRDLGESRPKMNRKPARCACAASARM